MFDDLNDLYQQVILDHAKSPRNYHAMEHPSCQAQGHNPLCGDHVTLYLKLDGDKIADVSWQGNGCAISKASTSLLTDALKGKTRAEARAMFDKVHAMVTTGKLDESAGKLAAFAGVHKFPARVKCAILSWHAVMAAIDGKGEPVSTESETT